MWFWASWSAEEEGSEPYLGRSWGQLGMGRRVVCQVLQGSGAHLGRCVKDGEFVHKRARNNKKARCSWFHLAGVFKG